MNRVPRGDCTEWLTPEAAYGIAQAARAVLAWRYSPEDEKAAMRAAAAACLPALPAPMLEAAAAVASSDPPPPDHSFPSVAAADPGRLARRLALLAGGANTPAGAAAERLARAGAARIGGDSN